MLFRNCAGGVIFREDEVFLLKNEKSEWVLPKGIIRGEQLAHEVALARVKAETGVDADILATAGETSYEFYSMSRRKPVCNRISWFVMRAKDDSSRVATDLGFLDGGYYPYEKALDMITYSQDRSLVKRAYAKYQKSK